MFQELATLAYSKPFSYYLLLLALQPVENIGLFYDFPILNLHFKVNIHIIITSHFIIEIPVLNGCVQCKFYYGGPSVKLMSHSLFQKCLLWFLL
jgi:hypothetical protein